MDKRLTIEIGLENHAVPSLWTGGEVSDPFEGYYDQVVDQNGDLALEVHKLFPPEFPAFSTPRMVIEGSYIIRGTLDEEEGFPVIKVLKVLRIFSEPCKTKECVFCGGQGLNYSALVEVLMPDEAPEFLQKAIGDAIKFFEEERRAE